MINNPAINAALSEMEQNLKNLESARKQVDQVSEKSKEIIMAVASLVNSVEKLNASYVEEERNLKQVFTNVSNDLSLSFNGSIEEVKNATTEYYKYQEEHINALQSSVHNLNKSFDETIKKLDGIDIEKNYALVKDSLDNHSSIIDSNLNNIIDELKEFIVQSSNQLSSFNQIHTKLDENQIDNVKKLDAIIDQIKLTQSELTENVINQNLSFQQIIINSNLCNEKIDLLSKTNLTKQEQLSEDLAQLTQHIENMQSDVKLRFESIVQEIKQSSAQIESNNNITKTRVDNLTILLNDFINQQNKVLKNQEIKLNNIQITVIIFFVILFFTALIF
jgi:methyl-accepting chemotaxis protein